MYRTMVTLLKSDNFFKPSEVENIKNSILSLQFVEKEYGHEVENFQLIQPGIEEIFSRVVGEPLMLKTDISGIFRIPKTHIHFESFDSPNEWIYAVALEKCIFNVYYHLSGAKNALEGWKFNYRNLLEWDYHTNILLEPNQGIFFRPWIFHSFVGGLIHQYRLVGSQNVLKKKIILITGLPGSGKSTLAQQLAEQLNATYINGDQVRKIYRDNDFSYQGRYKQAERLRRLAAISEDEFVVIDAVCPLTGTRDTINPDFIIWMNTIEKSKYADTNEMFQKPENADIIIDSFQYNIEEIINRVKQCQDKLVL